MHREGLREGSRAHLDARAALLAGSSQQMSHIGIVPGLPYQRSPAVILPWPSRQLLLKPACKVLLGFRKHTSNRQESDVGTLALSGACACSGYIMLCFPTSEKCECIMHRLNMPHRKLLTQPQPLWVRRSA